MSSSEKGKGLSGFFRGLRKPSHPNSSANGAGVVSVGGKTVEAGEAVQLLQASVAEKEAALKERDATISSQLEKIKRLEDQVHSLQSECDKLRSVLVQKAPDPAQKVAQKTSRTSDDAVKQITQEGVALAASETAQPRRGKMAISAEPATAAAKDAKLEHHDKPPAAKQLIKDAVQANDFLRQLDHEQVIEMVECMYEQSVKGGEWVIREGDPGSALFVAASGELQVSRDKEVLGQFGPGRVFGELAILYNCTRTASVKALTDTKLWVLDRSVYQMITMKMGMERQKTLMDFLRKLEFLEKLPEDLREDRLSKLADVMDQDYYAEGHCIIREGEKGSSFFIISSGTVRVTQMVEGSEQEIRIMQQGDFFGEKALLGEDNRTASVTAQAPGVEVLTLDRADFLNLIGDLESIRNKSKSYDDHQRKLDREAEPPSPKSASKIDPEFAELKLADIRTIATLGVGGFGRVELVCIGADKSRTFALKALKKKHIVDTRQQEHIFAERNIMMELRTDWVVRLFKTFRDRKYVYMLLEACLGGELWTTLRDRGHFDDQTARFYVACVLEGLEFLHRRKIIYRDLKPENCLITNTGYLKLVDFGFAKKLQSGRKTWTFCGTPEYVSPEIILNKGHDMAADYWALGIYISELLLGRPPFQASDPMKTYTLILKGVDALDIPNRRIGKTVTTLIKKLCKENPAERLGCQSGAVDDIRRHKWFMGFDWDGLRGRSLRPPILPKVASPMDMSNFDHYPPDDQVPPDEFSGWDEGF